jgi:hypothetical protein
MLRHLVIVVLASTFAGCIPPSTSPAGYVYYVPVVPLHAFPPAPFHSGHRWWLDPPPPAPATIVFEPPSLAARALSARIGESASRGDCATALEAGNELEQIDHESNHALLAVDESYASCVRGVSFPPARR